MNLRFERGALDDLDEIFSFIAADNEEAAAQPDLSQHPANRDEQTKNLGTPVKGKTTLKVENEKAP